jgi:hypothetical protein
MSQKGQSFERSFCVQLSLWWSSDQDEDLFWRSSQSGGRATSRAKRGKQTRGHCGDVCATDSEGELLMRWVTVELKKGYNKTNPYFLLDSLNESETNAQEFAAFIKQARSAAKRAGTAYWWLVHKRDYRQTMIFTPLLFWNKYVNVIAYPSCLLRIKLKGDKQLTRIAGMRLDDFFKVVKAAALKKYLTKAITRKGDNLYVNDSP